MKVTPARWASFNILRRVEEEGAYSSALLAAQEEALKPADRALCHELTLGVLRWQLWLDRLAEHYSGRPAAQLDGVVRTALRLGLYQLRRLERVPASAAVNESVKLVQAARKPSAAGFVNAVLRRAGREPEVDPAAGIDDPLERLAVATSHPLWLIKYWTAQFGSEETAALARANNLAPPLVLRLGRQVPERDVWAELRAAGAGLTPAPLVAGAWRLAGMTPLARDLAAEGWIYWQDEASQLVAHAAGAQAGERILDVCAAPGSKTTYLAASAPAAEVVAGDLYEHRLRLVREAATRQGLDNIATLLYDATRPLPFAPASFDCVLVDAPCSGTGTLRRNPEIRWRITENDFPALAARQQAILHEAARVVRPGGRLLYAACSLEHAENEAVSDAFAAAHPEFAPLLPPVPGFLHTAGSYARTWPQREGTDGFFLAVWARRAA